MVTSTRLLTTIVLLAALFLSAPLIGYAQTSTSSATGQTADKPPAAPRPTITPPAGPTPIKIGSLTLSGSIRARWESWDWFTAPGYENQYNLGGINVRLALSQQKPRYEWQVEAFAPILINLPERAIAPAPQGQLGLGGAYFAANGRQDASVTLRQAYFRFKGIGSDAASSLKIGRFDFMEGMEITPTDASLATIKREHIAQRLIGGFGFTHVGRGFDGIQYVRNAKSGNFTFAALRPTEGVFQLRSWNQLDVDFYYGAFSKPFKAKTHESEIRVFGIHYHDGRRVAKTDNRALAVRNAETEKIRLTTLGGHAVGVRNAGAGKVDWLAWGAGQFGDWGALQQRGGAVALEGGYQFTSPAVQRLKPWVRAGYFHSTGDGNPLDNRHGTFFQMLPTPRLYARFPFFNEMNNEDVFVQLRLKPHAKLGIRTDWHHLRLSNRNDLWYLGGGAFQRNTFGFVGRPSNGARGLGDLFDVSFDATLSPRTALTFYLAGVKGGSVPQRIYPTGKNAHFAYLELTQRF